MILIKVNSFFFEHYKRIWKYFVFINLSLQQTNIYEKKIIIFHDFNFLNDSKDFQLQILKQRNFQIISIIIIQKFHFEHSAVVDQHFVVYSYSAITQGLLYLCILNIEIVEKIFCFKI